MRRRSLGSILISNLDPNVKDRILNMPIREDLLKKFDEDEKREDVANLIDLRDLRSKTETEVYDTLNRMYKNKQFFIYCGPLLININPGPNYVNDYLNLEKWRMETKNVPDTKWKPHLYAFGNYVYQTMCNENKDQVINMLGQIGSGKTFNLIHLMEYFCHLGADKKQNEIFDVIHKSIQLVHMMGSIYRQNNIESTSCGMLLRLGFNEQNKICTFDIESKILDFTLPFSQNGRTFSILHSLMTGANQELKKLLELPEYDHQLNFFKKFCNNFNDKTKEKFKLNDLEIWTKFHSLMNFFNFSKTEVMEILQLLSFILLCNESAIGKKKFVKNEPEEFCIINKGHSSKKLSKILNMTEEEFLKRFGSFKDLNEIKNSLIGLMKNSYYMVFEFVKIKVKTYLKTYFENLNQVQGSGFFSKFKKNEEPINNEKVKYINFIDFPGEVEDQTLGGLSTNLANECLNVYAGTQYLSVVEKLEDEKLNLKYFQPLHSFHVVQSLISQNGIFNFLSQPFTEENYRKFQSKVNNLTHYNKSFYFKDNAFNSENQFLFNLQYSHMNVQYNYEGLYMESKSTLATKKIYNLFAASKNSIVKATFKKVLDVNKNFFDFTTSTIKEFFKPIEGISPFVIYCLHSINSQKIFFGDKFVEKDPDWAIPLKLTISMLKNSITIPVLYWEWFGYHEWVQVNDFVKEFQIDFVKIKDKLLKNKKLQDMSLSQLNDFEVASYILSVLGSDKYYILGSNHVILKKGTLKMIRNIIIKMLEMIKPNNTTNFTYGLINSTNKNSINMTKRGSISITNAVMKDSKTGVVGSRRSISNLGNKNSDNNNLTNENIKNIKPQEIKRKGSVGYNTPSISNKEVNHMNNPLISLQPLKKNSVNVKKDLPSSTNLNQNNIPERRQSMKVQCHLNILENNSLININQDNSKNNSLRIQPNMSARIYNLYGILDESEPTENTQNSQISSTENSIEKTPLKELKENEQYERYKKENNIILPKSNYFNNFKNLLDFSKNTNYQIFDYNECVPEIKKIQNAFRAFKARKKYKIYRYVVKKICMAQRWFRGFIIRKKFKKFQYCHNCIVFIQRLFKMRIEKRNIAAIKIQNYWRRKKETDKAFEEIERERREIDARLNSSDDDEDSRFMNLNAELMNASIKKEKRGSHRKQKMMIGTLSLDELEQETDGDKIVEHLLMEQAMTNQKDPIISLGLKQQKGISRKLKKNITQSKLNVKKTIPKSSRKIEDKLIEFGETVKLKKAERQFENMKNEEFKYSFKPEVNSVMFDPEKNGGNDFLERMEFCRKKQEKKLEEMRNKHVDPSILEYTLKPQVSQYAKEMKRNRDDLFNWKNKKDEILIRKQKEKEYKEMISIEQSIKEPKINKNSEILVKQKLERTMKEKMNTQPNEDDFDLWPVNMEKNYFQK